jgi:hypothetical protein
MYPVHHEAGVPSGLNSIMTDFLFHCPSQRWANSSSSRSPQCVRVRCRNRFCPVIPSQVPLHVQPLATLQHLQQELLRRKGVQARSHVIFLYLMKLKPALIFLVVSAHPLMPPRRVMPSKCHSSSTQPGPCP